MEDPFNNATQVCMYHSSGFGHIISGIRCRSARNLPDQCFCWDGVCGYPYISFKSIMRRLLLNREKIEDYYDNNYIWRIDDIDGSNITAKFSLINNRIFLPIEILVQSLNHNFGSRKNYVRQKYSIIQFEPSDPFLLRSSNLH